MFTIDDSRFLPIDRQTIFWRERLKKFSAICGKKIGLHGGTNRHNQWSRIFKIALRLACAIRGHSAVVRRMWPDYDAALVHRLLKMVPATIPEVWSEKNVPLAHAVAVLLRAGGTPDGWQCNNPEQIESLAHRALEGRRVQVKPKKQIKKSPPKSQSIPPCEPPAGIKPVWADSIEHLRQLGNISFTGRYCQKILVQRGFAGRSLNTKKTPPRMQIWAHPEGIKVLRDR